MQNFRLEPGHIDPRIINSHNNAISLDGRAIIYNKYYRILAGSVTSTILFRQIDFWMSVMKKDNYIKYTEPPEDRKPKPFWNPAEGNISWTEELGFSSYEFRKAFESIGVRHECKKDWENALSTSDEFVIKYEDKNKVSTSLVMFYCSYIDKKNGHTYYFRNDKLITFALYLFSKYPIYELNIQNKYEWIAPTKEQYQDLVNNNFYSGDWGILEKTKKTFNEDARVRGLETRKKKRELLDAQIKSLHPGARRHSRRRREESPDAGVKSLPLINSESTTEITTERTQKELFLPDAAIAGAGTQNNSNTQDKLEPTNNYAVYQNHTESNSNSLVDKSNSIAAKESDFLNAALEPQISNNGHDSSKPFLVNSGVPANSQNFSINAGNLNTIPNGVSSFNINPSWSNISPMAAKEKNSDPPPMKTSNDQFPAQLDLTISGTESISDQKENSAKEKGRNEKEMGSASAASEISPELTKNELDPINPQSGSHALQKIDPIETSLEKPTSGKLAKRKKSTKKTEEEKYLERQEKLKVLESLEESIRNTIDLNFPKNVETRYLEIFNQNQDSFYQCLADRTYGGFIDMSRITSALEKFSNNANFSILNFLCLLLGGKYKRHEVLIDFVQIQNNNLLDYGQEARYTAPLIEKLDYRQISMQDIEDCYLWMPQALNGDASYGRGLASIIKAIPRFTDYRKKQILDTNSSYLNKKEQIGVERLKNRDYSNDQVLDVYNQQQDRMKMFNYKKGKNE